MKMYLANTAIFKQSVFTLQLWTIGKHGTVIHRPFEQETPMTTYIGHLLIIGNDGLADVCHRNAIRQIILGKTESLHLAIIAYMESRGIAYQDGQKVGIITANEKSGETVVLMKVRE